MTSITLNAPAKVNLFLKVLNKRNDSYHNLFTLFERISLADRVTVARIPKGIVVSSDRRITADPKENIAYRSAELLMRRKNIPCGVSIRIEKRIPIAAGLGGGSSDAACVLVGMNRLFRLKLDKKALLGLAEELGSDVPFFIFDTPYAIARSRGERLARIASKARFWHLVVFPGFRVSTRQAYEALDRARGSSHETYARDLTLRQGSGSSHETYARDLTSVIDDVTIKKLLKTHSTDLGSVEAMLHNDLGYVVASKKRFIGETIRRLADLLNKKVNISGSGPSLFCLYGTRREVVKAKKLVEKKAPTIMLRRAARGATGWQVFIARTC